MSMSKTSSLWTGVNAPGRTVFLSRGLKSRENENPPISRERTFSGRDEGVLLDITHSCRVDGTDLKAGRIQRAYLLLEFIGGGERVVTQIHVVLQRECDLAVREEPAGDVLVVEPLEDRLEGVKPTIESEHEFRSWRLYLCGGHGCFRCAKGLLSTFRDAERNEWSDRGEGRDAARVKLGHDATCHA